MRGRIVNFRRSTVHLTFTLGSKHSNFARSLSWFFSSIYFPISVRASSPICTVKDRLLLIMWTNHKWKPQRSSRDFPFRIYYIPARIRVVERQQKGSSWTSSGCMNKKGKLPSPFAVAKAFEGFQHLRLLNSCAISKVWNSSLYTKTITRRSDHHLLYPVEGSPSQTP